MSGWKAQREGDPNSAGGIALGGAISVIINGRPAGVSNMIVTPHSPCPIPASHCNARTISSCKSVIIEGIHPTRTDVDIDTCGHPRAVGSPDVMIGS